MALPRRTSALADPKPQRSPDTDPSMRHHACSARTMQQAHARELRTHVLLGALTHAVLWQRFVAAEAAAAVLSGQPLLDATVVTSQVLADRATRLDCLTVLLHHRALPEVGRGLALWLLHAGLRGCGAAVEGRPGVRIDGEHAFESAPDAKRSCTMLRVIASVGSRWESAPAEAVEAEARRDGTSDGRAESAAAEEECERLTTRMLIAVHGCFTCAGGWCSMPARVLNALHPTLYAIRCEPCAYSIHRWIVQFRGRYPIAVCIDLRARPLFS